MSWPALLALFFGIGGFLAGVGFMLDPWGWQHLPVASGSAAHAVAEWLSFWGDFPTGTILLGIALLLGGWWLKRRNWLRLAVALMLGAAVAGTLVNGLRLTQGRPRPAATVEAVQERLGTVPQPWLSLGRELADGGLQDGFYGLQRPAMFHGFPSGHAATAMGTAAAAVVVNPIVGAMLMPVALGVCWSRMALHRHSVSDILVGAWFGLFWGFVVARHPRVCKLEERGA